MTPPTKPTAEQRRLVALLTPEEREAGRRHLIEQAWATGRLRYLLHADQKRVYDRIKQTQGRFVMEISRKWGKTWLLTVLAFEACLAVPKTRVAYGAPTLKHLEEFIIPVIDELSDLAPDGYRPVFLAAKGHLVFPNGSWVHLFGADDKRKANRGRGPKAKITIFDEAGFCDVLSYVLTSVFGAQMMLDGGIELLGSTPAETPDHDFTQVAEIAEAGGFYERRTIYDNPMMSPERIRIFIAEQATKAGLSIEDYLESEEWQREYLARRVVNKLLVCVPEWEKHAADCTGAVERPEYFDAWVSLDKGGADPHAALFGYYHFLLGRDVVERELLLKKGENTLELATAIKAIEKELWGVNAWSGTLRGNTDEALFSQLPEDRRRQWDSEEPQQPYWRISDNDTHLINDLYDLHKLQFCPTQKGDKELQVNNFRVAVVNHKWLIHPGCKDTVRHIKNTTWANNQRMTYARRAGEHGDLLDCLVYKNRNPIRRNPIPAHLALSPGQRVRLQAVREMEGESLAGVFGGDSPLARKLRGR